MERKKDILVGGPGHGKTVHAQGNSFMYPVPGPRMSELYGGWGRKQTKGWVDVGMRILEYKDTGLRHQGHRMFAIHDGLTCYEI